MVLQLAYIHMNGLRAEANCSKAAGFVRVVLQEGGGWSEEIIEAVAALDEGATPHYQVWKPNNTFMGLLVSSVCR